MLQTILEWLERELIYLWYYCDILCRQLLPFYLIGTLLGSLISVFAKVKIQHLFAKTRLSHLGVLSFIPAALLGFASPICMYGTLPLAAACCEKGVRQDTLACFMTASVLLNPQLIAYSAALGPLPFALRLGSCFLMALVAGLLVRYCYKNREFFAFSGFYEQHNRDTHPNVLLRYIKNVGRNLKVTTPYFIAGIVIAALFTIHQPQDDFADLFGKDNGLGVLFAATLGVPLYMCGGGTIPILIAWLASGMSLGSATAFMLSGPATKITNLAALKAVLGVKHFVYYLIYVIVFALFTGLAVNTLFSLMH